MIFPGQDFLKKEYLSRNIWQRNTDLNKIKLYTNRDFFKKSFFFCQGVSWLEFEFKKRFLRISGYFKSIFQAFPVKKRAFFLNNFLGFSGQEW